MMMMMMMNKNGVPILFKGDMIQATLEGRKTQTRRVIKDWPRHEYGDLYSRSEVNGPEMYTPVVIDKDGFQQPGEDVFGIYDIYGEWGMECPYGQVGDRLWVKHRADLFPVYFKPIEGYENKYWVGTDGKIYRSNSEELLGSPNSKGYLNVTLCDNGIKQTRNIHDLICRAFYGEPSAELNQVRHLDGNSQNNLPENLDWGSQEDNWGDRKYHGRGMGEAHHAAKLTTKQCADIITSNKSQRQLATQYGVSPATIWAVRNNKTWSTNIRQKNRNFPAFQLWKSPLFMPRWASRITLEITGIRVERVQDISEADAIAEDAPGIATHQPYPRQFRDSFQSLWDSINAKRGYSWADNPWVWIIEFRRIAQEGE